MAGKKSKEKSGSKIQKAVQITKLLMGTRRGRTAIFSFVGFVFLVISVAIYFIIGAIPKKQIIPEKVIGQGDERPRVIIPTSDVRMGQLANSLILNPPVPESAEEDSENETDDDKKLNNESVENHDGFSHSHDEDENHHDEDETKEHYHDEDKKTKHAYPVKYNDLKDRVDVSFEKPYKNVTVSRPVVGTDVVLTGRDANYVVSNKDFNPDEALKLVEPERPIFDEKGGTQKVPSYLRMEENKIDPNLPPVELKEQTNELLAQNGRHIVPKVAKDGRKAWSYYARPFHDATDSPKIAIVITNLGLDETATEVAVKRLPFEVTLSYSPYADNLKEQMAYARENGHEVMIDMPIEQVDEAIIDVGPYALMSSKSDEKNQRLLDEMLSLGEGTIGLIGTGHLLGGDKDRMRKVLKTIRNYGLLYVADNYGNTEEVVDSVPGLPHADITVDMDGKHFRTSVEARMEYLTKHALADGVAVGIGSWSPLTMNILAEWLIKFQENGIVLAPVSAVVNEN
jgi:polysaccharide deacetylase 2 family uncharacterized protein YibQ